MGATGRLWLLVILALGSNFSNHEGTILASAPSTEKAESQDLPPEIGGCSGTQGQVLEGRNSLYCCTSRISSTEKHPEDGSPRMELSVPGNRCEEQREQILLQQLREPLQHREMVAADKVVEDKVKQSATTREEKTGSTDWQGAERVRPVGTLWYRRTIGNNTVGGDDPYTRSVQALMPQVKPAEMETTGPADEKEKSEKSEVTEKIETLKKALVQMGVSDAAILAQIEEVEQATKETQPPAALTHKVLHQLQRTEKQMLALQTQVKELDTKWQQWSEYMKTKFTEQGNLYKSKRKELTTRHAELKTKLDALRLEVKRAANEEGPKDAEFIFQPAEDPSISSSEDEGTNKQEKRPAPNGPKNVESPAKAPKRAMET